MPPEITVNDSPYTLGQKLHFERVGISGSTSGNVQLSQKIRQLIPFFELQSSQNSVQVLVWNISTNRFIYESDIKKVVGFDDSCYLDENGINFSLSKIHPDFFQASLNMKKKIAECLGSNSDVQNRMVINVDGTCKKESGEYIHFLLQCACLEKDNLGVPQIMLNYIHDITHIKKMSTANLIVNVSDNTYWWNFNFDAQSLEEVRPLSKQEKKVLYLLSRSKTSKEIASELFLSPLTVDTHRKNLLRKTNCYDTTAMVTYAKLVGLL